MSKIKVLLVSHEAMINGASYSLLNLIDSLNNKCDFTIIVPYDYGPFLAEIKKRNIKVYYVPFKRWVTFKDDKFKKAKLNWLITDNRNNEKLARKISKILKDEKFDIIHSNTSVIDLGYRISKILKIPHIWHIREFGKDDFSMYPLCSKRSYYKKICDKNNQLVCISKAVYEKYKNRIEKSRIKVIYNGVSKDNINPHKNFPKAKDKLIFLQTGMINKAKGQDITIKAFDELYKEGYKNFELWLAGTGSLEDIGISDITNKEWLKQLGQVENIQELRKKVNVEIVSSQKECFGRVTVEAMMGQIPVIGTNSGGTKELIKDNDTGLLFTPGSITELKEKIKFLYNNRKEIKRMGKKAYKDTKDYFLIDRCANEIFELYNEKRKNNYGRFE